MKILQICTTEHRGAGKAAFRLHVGLKAIGVDSKMLVLKKVSGDKDIIQLVKPWNIIGKVINRINRWFISREYYSYNLRRETSPFSDDRTPYRVSKHHLVKDRDIIILRWVANMVDCSEFFKNVKKTTIWRIADMNPFTGGCHTALNCEKFTKECGACPKLNSKKEIDLSRKIFKRKESAYKDKKLYIVSPSLSFSRLIKKSRLFKKYPIKIIPNGIPTSIFKPREKSEARMLLGIPKDKTIILFGSDYFSETKGLDYLITTIRYVLKRINQSCIAMLTFGECKNIFPKNIGCETYHMGYIVSEEKLSYVYSAANMFIMPSLQESFGQTTLEAMACGTPVVGFSTGAIEEVVKNDITGFKVELGDTNSLAEKIEWLIHNKEKCLDMGRMARKLVEAEYTLEKQAEKYKNFCEEILSKE